MRSDATKIDEHRIIFADSMTYANAKFQPIIS